MERILKTTNFYSKLKQQTFTKLYIYDNKKTALILGGF